MIKKWWEVSCNQCGSAEHFTGTKAQANEQASDMGWTIINGFHFCTDECCKKFHLPNVTGEAEETRK